MLIISPKTYSKTVKQFIEFFGAVKSEVPFWHSNFRDYHFTAMVGTVPVHLLFCGYGEGTTAHGVIHGYDRFLRKDDACPGVIYVGACFATSASDLQVGDIVIPNSTYSDSDVVKDMHKLLGESEHQIDQFDQSLIKKSLMLAEAMNVPAKTGKIFCKETYDRDFWFNFAESAGPKGGYIAAEVESAACLAASKTIGVPCIAFLEVKDKLDKENGYIMANDAARAIAFGNMLKIIKATLASLGNKA